MIIMSDYKICKRCVMDTSDIEITFDEMGNCNHCNNYFTKIKMPTFSKNKNEEELKKLIQSIKTKNKNNSYDCIIGVSGGTDSSYTLYTACKLGLKPLAVHIDTGWNSVAAVKNIKQLCTKLNVDFECLVVDWNEFKAIQKAVLQSGIVEVELPTDVAIIGGLHKIAAEKNINYIISGCNTTSEGILPEKWFYNPKDKKLLKTIISKYSNTTLNTLPTLGIIEELHYKLIRKIKIVYLLDYVEYNSKIALEFLQQHFNLLRYAGKHHESIFTAFAQSYIQPKKFNLDYRRATLSSLICANTVTRQEALQLLEKPAHQVQGMNEIKEYVLKKLNYTPQQFEEIMKAKPLSYQNYSNNEKVYNFIILLYNLLVKKQFLKK
jgi:N-acetyl sugar amidotransferase